MARGCLLIITVGLLGWVAKNKMTDQKDEKNKKKANDKPIKKEGKKKEYK